MPRLHRNSTWPADLDRRAAKDIATLPRRARGLGRPSTHVRLAEVQASARASAQQSTLAAERSEQALESVKWLASDLRASVCVPPQFRMWPCWMCESVAACSHREPELVAWWWDGVGR